MIGLSSKRSERKNEPIEEKEERAKREDQKHDEKKRFV
jgi:hypothetical protein